ncbi:unnamed protein product [Prunus armeniaca]
MSCKFGPDRTVGLLTIAQSDGYLNPNPRVGISGVSGTPFYDPTIQRSKPSEPGKYAICDIRSGL